jgi:potassium/hydrogen antiporter
MDITTILIALGLLIFGAHIFSALFNKTRIPSVLLLLLIGLMAGPVFHWISPEFFGNFGSVFTTLTLITILFESGTNLQIGELKRSVLGATALTLVNFLIALGIGIAIGRLLLNLDWMYSLFLGAALGGTSSAVVIPMVNQLRPGAKAGTMLFLESAFSDVLCLVVSLALLGGIETGQLSVLGMFSNMGVSLIFALLIGIGFGVVWTIFLKKVLTGMKNTMFTSFATAFILYGLAEKLNLNGGLCVLAYGITMGNIGNSHFFKRMFQANEESTLNQEEKNFYSEIVFILQTYFFVYIGISIQLDNPWHILVGGILVAGIFLSRILSARVIGKKGTDTRDRRLIMALGPKGLVAAVLASLPMQKAAVGIGDLHSAEIIQNVSYATVLISILLCSILVFIIEKTSKKQESGISES